jgi:hypothetical protein
MDPIYDQLEHRLEAQLKQAENLKKTFSDRMASDQHMMHAYHMTIARLRDLNMRDTRKGESNTKAFIGTIGSVQRDARQALAFKAPGDGMAKTVMRYLPHFGLGREESLSAALLCIQEDCEQSFGFLDEAKLPAEDQELAVLAAIKHYPILNFEDFKTQEILYQTANVQDPREMAEIKRRFEQVRGKKMQHVRKHILNYIPHEVREHPDFRKVLLEASLERDTYGSLEMMRESASQENLKANSANILDGLSVEDRLELLEIVAGFGLGLASSYLDLFAIPNEPEWVPRLREILKRDVTAGQSLFGAFAFEGIHHYPFELERIEITLPRRITNADAVEYLRQNEPDGEKPRTYTSFELGEVVTVLQDKDVRRFLENLKYGIAHGWKSCVQDIKREVVFGDYDLKVRDVLFLVACSLFEDEEKFKNAFSVIQKSHPHINDDLPKVYLYANRYYLLELLGLNMGFLFNRYRKPNGSFASLIEDVGDYQIRTFMHFGISLFIRVGDALFRDVTFAWNMLIGQCEGKIDAVFHEVGGLFDTFDTLLAIMGPAIGDLQAYLPTLIGALLQDAPSLPPEDPAGAPRQQLKVATRATIARIRECLNRYSLDALYVRVKKSGATPISIVQTLKMPRSKTDKLMNLLQNDPLKGKR